MKKIPSLYKREWTGNRQIYNEVTPGTEWVLNGEGIATRKFDGTACMIRDGKLFARYDAKKKNPPADFIPCIESPDPNTGHWPGWVPVTEDNPTYKYHIEAWKRTLHGLPEGTYELCGPKINSNREGLSDHVLIKHGSVAYDEVPTEFNALKEWLRVMDIEGVVWHHPDGRMVKIKKRDFGFDW